MELHCRLPPLHDFTPIAVGTLGVVGELVLDFLQEHGRRITRTTTDEDSVVKKHGLPSQTGESSCCGTETKAKAQTTTMLSSQQKPKDQQME